MKYSTSCIQHTYNTPLKYNQDLHYNSVIGISYLVLSYFEECLKLAYETSTEVFVDM